MKSRIIKSLVLILFLNLTIQAQTIDDSESEAKNTVSNFFKYLNDNDVEKIKTSIAPDRYEMHQKLNDWNKWINLWQSYSLVEVGSVEKWKFVRKGRDKTVKVHIILNVDGQDMNGTINVSLINEHWTWDEN